MILCAHCGHRIYRIDGGWEHKLPHPEHICRCTTPEPRKKKEKIQGGVTTYSGYVAREVFDI